MCKKHVRLARRFRTSHRPAIIRRRSILSFRYDVPNAETLAAMNECLYDMEGAKSYTNVDDMLYDIMSE